MLFVLIIPIIYFFYLLVLLVFSDKIFTFIGQILHIKIYYIYAHQKSLVLFRKEQLRIRRYKYEKLFLIIWSIMI